VLSNGLVDGPGPDVGGGPFVLADAILYNNLYNKLY
jgi:hypothetical protein